MDAVMALDAVAIVMLFGPLLLAAFDLASGDVQAVELTQGDLWINAAALMLLFGVVPFTWIAMTRNDPRAGTIAYFRLGRPWTHLGIGVLGGIGLVILLILVGLVLVAFDAAPENPGTDALASGLTWPLVIALSVAAGVGEEVLFRGILQKHITWVGQALLFGALHAYQGVFAVVAITVLALLFGYVIHRGVSLWVTIGAHTTFDLIQLSLVRMQSLLEGA